MAKVGYITTPGDISPTEADSAITGTVAVDGAQVRKGSVDASECGAGTGAINYPSVPTWGEGMAVAQYAFAVDFCGATMTGLEFSAPTGHFLAKLNPQSAGWAAVARNLSFSATPAMALPKTN